MSRRSPSWRHSCLFITGALTLAGCTGASTPEEVPSPQQQSSALASGPDLRITGLQAPDSARPGETFTVTARVCNTGNQPAYVAGNTLQVYLSTTATQQVPAPGAPPPPPTSQITLGQTDVGPLDAGQCVSRSLSVPANPPSGFMGNGAYYLGASVDTQQVVAETDETNNGFVRGLFGVGNQPDLVVTRVDAPASLNPGQPFTASATVCNVGTLESPGTLVELYLSTVNGLTLPSGPPLTTQAMVAGATLGSLSPGLCRTVSLNGYAQPPPASPPNEPLYLGAIVDPQRGVTELREDNNTFVQGLVGVGSRPDLTIRSVTGPASVRMGDSFPATVTVCNAGTVASNPADVQVLLSTVPSLAAPGTMPRPTTEAPVASFSAPPLGNGQCITRTVQAYAIRPPIPPSEDPLYLGAIVDLPRSQLELREDNNTRADTLLGVGSRPDLTIATLDVPPTVAPGQPFTATVKVCNVGTVTSPNAPVEVYVTSEPTLSVVSGPPPMSRMLAGTTFAPSLEPGECATRPVNASAYPPPGTPLPNATLYAGAIVDPTASVLELREDNNVSPLPRINLGTGADLVVRSLTAPASVRPGNPFLMDVTVCNEGNQFVPSSTVGLFMSSTPTVTAPPYTGSPPPTQVQVGTVAVSSLAAGACAVSSKTLTAIPPPESSPAQPLYLSAVADQPYQVAELRKDNNVRTSGPISVGSGPDLVVSSITGPSSVTPGGALALSVQVCNVGTEAAAPSQVIAVVSTEETLAQDLPSQAPPTEAPVGMAPTPTLVAGQCITVSVNGYESPPPYTEPGSPRFLGARVDPARQVAELREDNNTRVTSRLSVGNGPDLVIQSVTAPTGAPQGVPFVAQVKVCNVGSAPMSGSVPLDLLISTEPSAYVPAQGRPPMTQLQMLVGGFNLSPLSVGQCTTVPVQGTVMRPPAATSGQPLYLGAIVDAPGALPELREDNNTWMGGVFTQAQ
ncbi:CARDB domain-containing protein [Corallococcus sp. Z5C101001]|uniref:CARDB domain-containing protein n=1 Tax=Corallococcus sp. Z5C101001 TaxID=2596829 RepID=UPI00117C3911|nr:CARDB domain-containing protein [Corallococcus sp. Z5C101001]TSC26801.1 hypothetical protein FOF48_22325 [Corallococcus sp. Z5C101001]